MTMQLADWTAVEAEVDGIIAENTEEPFNQSTIANVRDFMRFAREHCPIPAAGKGYWSTICFSWSTTPPIEVEVFGDRFEFYRFYDRHTDIREVAHAPGTQFPQDLAADLPRRSFR